MLIRRYSLAALLLVAPACTGREKAQAPTADTALPGAPVPAKDSVPKTDADVAAARTPAVVAFETFDFATQKADSAAVYALSLNEGRLLRGLVFGRHGRRFVDDGLIQAYLDMQSWYKPDPTFTNDRLNDTERENLDLIRGSEAMRHTTIQPGDLRYYRGKAVTSAQLGRHTAREWHMLASEVFAMNGHTFNDFPDPDDEFAVDSSESLQLYYNDRYWYRPVGSLKRKDLPPADQALADSIDVARITSQDAWVTFGMMRLFKGTLLTEKNIRGNNVMDLRLMRNEVYAVRGRAFTTPWLKRMLAAYGYQPDPAYRESDLSDIEKQNIALIRKVEDELHESLSTAEIEGIQFDRMPLSFVRLLRNEIYARRGRVFRDPALQAYFAGFSWYKPNPAFTEAMLTDIEKRNAAELLKHEKFKAGGGRYHYPEA